MGFVRVSGYNQTDLDNAYAQGVTDADGRANPSSVNYQTGYSAGATYVAQHPVIVTNDRSTPIYSDHEDTVNVHIYNNTTNTLKFIIWGKMQGQNVVHTLNDTSIAIAWPTAYDFPPNGDLYLYQDGDGGASGDDGDIMIVVLGDYDTYQNLITWNDSMDTTSGNCTFS